MERGATLIVRTTIGDAEAKRLDGATAAESHWSIQYSWGLESYYGAVEQVVPHIRKKLAERDTARARHS